MRAYFGQQMAARAITAFCMPPPSTPATASANTKPGKARKMSETRMSTVSSFPPRQPHTTPTAVPKMLTIATKASVEKMLDCAPMITRDSKSRP